MHKDLEYYMNLDFDIILKKRGDVFVLSIPEIACVAEDTSLQGAYEKLEAEKKKYFEQMMEFGLQEDVVKPSQRDEKVEIKQVGFLRPFLMKTAIILFILAILITPFVRLASNLSQKLSTKHMVNAVFKLSSRFNEKVESLSDEEKETMRANMRKTLRELKPFFDDARQILSEEEGKPAPSEQGGQAR